MSKAVNKKGLRPRKSHSILDHIKNKLDQEFLEDNKNGEQSDEDYDQKSLNKAKKPYKKRQTQNGSELVISQQKTKAKVTANAKKVAKNSLKLSEEEKIVEDEDLSPQKIGVGSEDDQQQDASTQEDDYLDRLPKSKKGLQSLLQDIEKRILHYKQLFFKEQNEIVNGKRSMIPDNSIPICSDVTKLNFQALIDAQMRHAGKMFDVIMMDPPWQLSSSQPSRGVAIAYDSLSDEKIQNMPIQSLQQDGFIFVWAINAKYRFTIKMIENWGYKLVDEITWVKKTVNGKIAKGHGFYLQHAKESCLIGVKGDVDNGRFKKNIASDVIFSERRGQSQKPEEIYQYINQLCPNGNYLEIFARRNNLHDNWVSIGNEL
ncbi:hypothetical protein ABPG72_017335 [Tetrahymena utriculariae]